MLVSEVARSPRTSSIATSASFCERLSGCSRGSNAIRVQCHPTRHTSAAFRRPEYLLVHKVCERMQGCSCRSNKNKAERSGVDRATDCYRTPQTSSTPIMKCIIAILTAMLSTCALSLSVPRVAPRQDLAPLGHYPYQGAGNCASEDCRSPNIEA